MTKTTTISNVNSLMAFYKLLIQTNGPMFSGLSSGIFFDAKKTLGVSPFLGFTEQKPTLSLLKQVKKTILQTVSLANILFNSYKNETNTPTYFIRFCSG